MNNQRIISLVKELQQRTVENGFSEAEANISQQKAENLIKNFGLTPEQYQIPQPSQAQKMVRKLDQFLAGKWVSDVGNGSLLLLYLVPAFIIFHIAVVSILEIITGFAIPFLWLFTPILALICWKWNHDLPMNIIIAGISLKAIFTFLV